MAQFFFTAISKFTHKIKIVQLESNSIIQLNAQLQLLESDTTCLSCVMKKIQIHVHTEVNIANSIQHVQK